MLIDVPGDCVGKIETRDKQYQSDVVLVGTEPNISFFRKISSK